MYAANRPSAHRKTPSVVSCARKWIISSWEISFSINENRKHNRSALIHMPMHWIKEDYQNLDRSPRALRRFGIVLGSALLLLGGLLLWRHHRSAGLALVSISALFVVIAGLAPLLLKWIHGPWMILSLALVWVMSRTR